MSEYPAFIIVSTIWNGFLKYRGLKPVPQELRTGVGRRAVAPAPAATPLEPPTRDAVVAEMERFAYFRIDAERTAPRGKRNRVVFLILAKGGDYSRFSPDLKKLLESIAAEKATAEGRLDELIIVAEEEFFERKLLLETVKAHADAAAAASGAGGKDGARGADVKGATAFYNVYHYYTFALVIPEHVEVQPHRIMTDEEGEAFLRRERLAVTDLAAIHENDPPIIWLGGRVGQLVEITRTSETAMKSIAVRRIIRPA